MIINLTGLGYSGSTAFRDLLLEFEHIRHFNPVNTKYPEYYFISDPCGLLSIQSSLDENWNYLNSVYLIRENRKLFSDIYPKRRRFFSPYGLNLDNQISVNSQKAYKEFLKEISLFEFELTSRISHQRKSIFEKLLSKILNLFPDNKIDYLLNPDLENFEKATKNFHDKIFLKQSEKDIILIEKAIPISNLKSGIRLFHNILNIICIRNPMDVFTDIYLKKKGIFTKKDEIITDKLIDNFLTFNNLVYNYHKFLTL